jgi:hypothetical protein
MSEASISECVNFLTLEKFTWNKKLEWWTKVPHCCKITLWQGFYDKRSFGYYIGRHLVLSKSKMYAERQNVEIQIAVKSICCQNWRVTLKIGKSGPKMCPTSVKTLGTNPCGGHLTPSGMGAVRRGKTNTTFSVILPTFWNSATWFSTFFLRESVIPFSAGF